MGKTSTPGRRSASGSGVSRRRRGPPSASACCASRTTVGWVQLPPSHPWKAPAAVISAMLPGCDELAARRRTTTARTNGSSRCARSAANWRSSLRMSQGPPCPSCSTDAANTIPPPSCGFKAEDTRREPRAADGTPGSALGELLEPSHLFASVRQSREPDLLDLPLLGGQGREPGFNRHGSAHRTPFDLAAEGFLVVGLLVDLACAAQPHFPCLDIARRNAPGDLFLPCGTPGETRGGIDFFEPSLEPGLVAVDHHQQSDRFLLVLPNVIRQLFDALQHETGPAVWLPGLYVDAAEMALHDRTEEPFLLDVLTQQQTSQFLLHSTWLPGRRARKASEEMRFPLRMAWRSQGRKVARTTRGNRGPDSP